MSVRRILVINPNSNTRVTDRIRAGLAYFSEYSTIDIDCRTLTEGPFGIESDEDIERVQPLLRSEVASSPGFDAYVIACYSDPGLEQCREVTSKPVLGIQSSALATAIARGGKFGVLALSETSILRHVAYIHELGFERHLAGEFALNLSVAEAESESVFEQILEGANRLVSEGQARVLILGCAGMAAHREPLESALETPVIDPTQAAVALALS